MDSLLSISHKSLEIAEIIKGRFHEINGYMPGYTHYREAMLVSVSTNIDH